MNEQTETIKLAINGGIGFGAKLSAKQLMTIAHFLKEEETIELTTFQQLYIEIPLEQKESVMQQFKQVGLHCYPVGNYVKSLRTCNFCKGELEEGMPVAKELNRRIAGKAVPFTLKPAYTGCAVGCGEPLVNDIGVMKIKEHYNLYIGGKAKGKDAQVGRLYKEGCTPDELYEAIERLLVYYAETGRKREPLTRFIERIGFDTLRLHLLEN